MDRIEYREDCIPILFNDRTYAGDGSYIETGIWLKENGIEFSRYTHLCWRRIIPNEEKLQWGGFAGYVIYDPEEFMGVKLMWISE